MVAHTDTSWWDCVHSHEKSTGLMLYDQYRGKGFGNSCQEQAGETPMSKGGQDTQRD